MHRLVLAVPARFRRVLCSRCRRGRRTDGRRRSPRRRPQQRLPRHGLFVEAQETAQALGQRRQALDRRSHQAHGAGLKFAELLMHTSDVQSSYQRSHLTAKLSPMIAEVNFEEMQFN